MNGILGKKVIGVNKVSATMNDDHLIGKVIAVIESIGTKGNIEKSYRIAVNDEEYEEYKYITSELSSDEITFLLTKSTGRIFADLYAYRQENMTINVKIDADYIDYFQSESASVAVRTNEEQMSNGYVHVTVNDDEGVILSLGQVEKLRDVLDDIIDRGS